MAKVIVKVQTIQEFETEIDDNRLRLELNRAMSAAHNDTIYNVEFIDIDTEINTIDELEKVCEQLYGEETEILSVIHKQTGEYIWY